MNALPVAHLFGFEVRLHVSWALILAVIAVTVATRIGELAAGSDPALRWVMGAAAAGLFLLTALAHELGHAIVARRAGMAGGPLVVYFYGSAASPILEAARPRDEILSAVAGPLVSLGIGVGLLGIAEMSTLVGGEAAGIIGQVALVVGVMNVILGAANLLPAFPLDGGRVIRGIAWARTGDPARALRFTARLGRRLGMILAGAGFVVVLLIDPVDGLLLALCGWFLVSTSRIVERGAEVDAMLEGILVGDVMDRDVSGVPPGLTLDTFGAQLLDGSGASSLPVVRGPELLGMIGVQQVRRLRRDRWPRTRAEDLMVAGDALPIVAPDTTLRAAVEQLRRSGMDGLPVLDAGVLSGIITRRAVADVVRAKVGRRVGARR